METEDEEKIREIVREELTNAIPTKKKGIRKPNKWQAFLRHCTPQQAQDLSMGEKVKACSLQYKEIKIKNGKLLDDLLAKYMEDQSRNKINQDQKSNQNSNQKSNNDITIKEE